MLSTRSYICVEQEDGKFKGVYCHSDGYLTYNGAILLDYYNSKEKAEEILALGDLSILKQKLHPDPNKVHSFDFDKRQPFVTIAYGRDRGENNTKAKEVDLKLLESDESWIEYVYIFKDNKWQYFECGRLEEGFRDVEQDLDAYFAKNGVERPKGMYGWFTEEDFAEIKQAQEQEQKAQEEQEM